VKKLRNKLRWNRNDEKYIFPPTFYITFFYMLVKLDPDPAGGADSCSTEGLTRLSDLVLPGLVWALGSLPALLIHRLWIRDAVPSSSFLKSSLLSTPPRGFVDSRNAAVQKHGRLLAGGPWEFVAVYYLKNVLKSSTASFFYCSETLTICT